MEKLFRLQENGTTVRTEVLAGLTTFIDVYKRQEVNRSLCFLGALPWNSA